MATILLDTHAWLWMLDDPSRFAAAALAVVESEQDELLLSAASAWEIAIKHGLGKLKLPEAPESYVPDRMRQTNVLPLRVTHTHALRAGVLPPHHRDPFDRLLIAQAQLENFPILTADRRFDRYDVEVIRAA